MAEISSTLVLFDLVSTITDAGPRYAEAYARVAGEYGLNVPQVSDIMAELGNRNLKEIIAIHSPDLPTDRVKTFMGDCNEACDALLYDVHWVERLYDGVRETLKELKDRGCAIGLFTGTREDAMEAQLRYHNIIQFFDRDLIRGKNNDRDGFKDMQSLKIEQMAAIRNAFRHRTASLQPVIAVGDSVSDYHAACAVKSSFIGFAETDKKVQDFVAIGVKSVFRSYENLPGLVSMMSQPAREMRPRNFGMGI